MSRYKAFLKRHSETIVDLFVIFITTFVVLAFLFHHFFSNPYYYLSADIAELYFPWWIYINHAVRSLQFPILNQYWFGGSLPFAALESSLFYPPYILIQFFFDASKNLNTAYFYHFGMEVGHYLFASVTFYLFGRYGLRLGRWASILSAVVYVTSGSFVGRFIHTVVVHTLAWLPSLLLMYFLFLEKKKRIYLLFTSLVLTLIVLSGHPQMVIYTYGYFIAIAFILILLQKNMNRLNALISTIIAIGVSILLTSFKFLLLIELAGQIVRTTNQTTIANLYNSLHPLYYLTLLVPYLFGKHMVGYWGSDYPWGNWDNFIYIGIIPLLLIPYALLHRKRKLVTIFIGLTLGTVFIMLGKYQSLSAYFNVHTPFASSMTMLSKFTNFLHFFLVILVGFGFDALFEGGKRKSLVLFLLITAGIGALLFIIHPKMANILQFGDREAPSAEALHFIINNITQARFLFFLSSIVVVSFIFLKKEILFWILLFCFALDMFLSAGDFNPIEASPGEPEKYFALTDITRFIKKDKDIFRIDNLWPRNVNMVQKIESTYGYHTIETAAYRRMTGLYNFENRQIANLFNAKYVVSDKDLSQYQGFTQVIPNLWMNFQSLPRLQFVPSARFTSSFEETISVLANPVFDARKEVILPKSFESITSNEGNGKGGVSIISYSGQKLIGKVSSTNGGYILWTQFQYPGWSVRVDGKQRSLIPADGSFYAIPVESGDHTVELFYFSKPMHQGFIISGVTIFLLILSFLFRKTRSFYFIPLIKAHGKRK